MRLPADQAGRDAAVAERARNVVLDAGAGTGKTSTLVQRLVAMVAPEGEVEAVPIERVAAVTFTRRAAGELKARVRAELLAALSQPVVEEARRRHLRSALGGLDTAYLGTIHSFADRLLRMRPVEARLSPAYEIVEDEQALVAETYERLLQGAQQGSLAAELAGSGVEDLAEEAAGVVRDAIGSRLRAYTEEHDFYSKYGLDALVEGLIRTRDVPVPLEAPAPIDYAALDAAMREFLARARPLPRSSYIGRWLSDVARQIEERIGRRDPLELLQRVAVPLIERRRGWNQIRKGHHCNGDKATWEAWQALYQGERQRPAGPLFDAIAAPLQRWLGQRLVRLQPVVLALYERVKARHQLVDQVDLLLELRNLLRDDLAARAFYQQRFAHIFVDEFQDTDPLQAEVLLYLCEREPRAASWRDVELAPGRLTIVGDPKQSIYRFRRADIAMYDQVRELIAPTALTVELEANFRSTGTLIDWFNDRFEALLGRDPAGRAFDAAAGQTFHRSLTAGKPIEQGPAVHVVPFEVTGKTRPTADDYRRLEAAALPRYLRWLVEQSGQQVRDPVTQAWRAVEYGDIAVLAVTTTHLPWLFTELDRFDIPYASSGGTLFLSDALHRQFLLGLRALADPDDGIAHAALLRPPFFAVDLQELFSHRGYPDSPVAARVREAKALITELRRDRFRRTPGDTARDLLERSGFGRAVALGANARQRLDRLRELCHLLDRQASEERLDYDGVTARLREWIARPVQIDAPRPAGAQAVQVSTVHQAKGLEFPVVVLWDGRAELGSHSWKAPWQIRRDAVSWALALYGLEAHEPAGEDLAATEKDFRDHERRRVVYVAATRARDLLVIPRAGDVGPGYICGVLLAGEPHPAVTELEVFRRDPLPGWAAGIALRARPVPGDAAALSIAVEARWREALAAASRPRYRPIGAAAYARSLVLGDDTEAETAPAKLREGRHGARFGTAVHQAIGAALADPARNVAWIVEHAGSGQPFTESADELRADIERAGRATNLAGVEGELRADVERALAALEALGLRRPPGPTLRLEYPVIGRGSAGELISGSIDLVAVQDDSLIVLDFKTDQPPAGGGDVARALPEYAEQVRLYARCLEAAGLCEGRIVRTGLLFTADGVVRWV